MTNHPKPFHPGYSFVDFWVLYSLILVFAILKYLFPGVLLPDWLNFRCLEARQWFSLLLSTTGTLLGILVAALLLSFQLIGKEAKRRRESNVLHNKWVIAFAGLSLFLIGALTISYILIPSFIHNNDLSIGYYLFYSFVAFLVLLFYIVYILLGYSNTVDKIRKVVSLLAINDFIDATGSYDQGNWMNSHSLKLSEIRDEVNYAIRDNDNGALQAILTELTSRVNAIISPEITRENCEAILESVVILWKDAEAFAARSQGSSFYEVVSNCIEVFYQHAATKNIPLLYYRALQNYYIYLAENLARKGDLISLRRIIDVLNKSLTSQLKNNCPVENSLQGLLKLYDQQAESHIVSAEIQWENIGNFFSDMSKIQKLAIDFKMRDLYTEVHRSLHLIATLIEHNDFPELGRFQRAYLLTKVIAVNLIFNGERALDEELFNDTLETYGLDGSLIANIIINDPDAARKILISIGDFLMTSRRKSKLNVWWTINEFGSIPRHTAKEYLRNGTVQVSTKYIFEVFKKMKEEIELSEVANHFKTYTEIKQQLQALLDQLTQELNGATDTSLMIEIRQCLGSFQQVNVQTDFNIVPWPGVQ